MARLLQADREIRATYQITTWYNLWYAEEHLWIQNTYSSRRTHQVALPPAKNRKLRFSPTRTHQHWTIEDWKMLLGLMSYNFYCNIWMAGSETGIKKHGSTLPCINSSGCCWWWCNGVGDIFGGYTLRVLRTNWELLHGDQICNKCVTPSCQYGSKSARNISSTLLNL